MILNEGRKPSSSTPVRERSGRSPFIPAKKSSQNGLRTRNLQLATERSDTMNREHAEQEVARLADAWATAELRADTAFFERTLADDFIVVGPLGFILTKHEWMARHQSDDFKHDARDLDEFPVRYY